MTRVFARIAHIDMTFDDLLSLEVDCEIVASDTAALLLLGDGAGDLAGALCQAGDASPAPLLVPVPSPAALYFGLPILTAPFPILVHSLMTERNTQLSQLSLFGWIEDNAILEPRAARLPEAGPGPGRAGTTPAARPAA